MGSVKNSSSVKATEKFVRDILLNVFGQPAPKRTVAIVAERILKVLPT